MLSLGEEMKYSPREPDPLFDSLEPVLQGLDTRLIDLSVSRRKGRGGKPGNVWIRLTVYKEGTVGVEDCSRVHRAVLPRLELAFPGSDLYLEVSSPGINRLIRDGAEFAPFIGKDVACYRLDTSGWSAGVLKSADTEKIALDCGGEELVLPYEVIAKAKLN